MAFLKSFRRAVRLLCVGVAVVGAIAVVSMMALVTVDVVGRDTISKPLLGSFELVAYAMVVAVCSAFAVAQSNNFHVKIDVLVNLLPRRWQAAIDSFNLLIMLLFVGGVAWAGYSQTLSVRASRLSSDVLDIAKWPFQLWLAAGWTVFFVAVLADLLVAVGTALGKDGAVTTVGSQDQLNVT